jgi:hypothetical protein
MSIELSQLVERAGFLEGTAAKAAPSEGALVTDYKQQICRKYTSLNPEQIEHRLAGTQFQVTRKYDGELAVIFYDGQQVFTVNTGGRVRAGLAVHAEAADRLRAAGITSAVVPAELYVAEDAGRTRVFDVAAVLADPSQHDRLRLAPFEIVSLDGDEHRPASYSETHAKLSEVFTEQLVRPVQLRQVTTREQVAAVYREWVDGEGAEGLVVRSDLPVVFKIKPVYTLDAAVIGYSENPEVAGQVRSLLLAMGTQDGRYQPVGHVGSGLNDDLRTQLHARLSPLEVPSTYIETDTNHVAFHLVRPDLVVEFKVNDVLFESTNGTVYAPLLEFGGSWAKTGTSPGISIIHPVLERVRDDKAASGPDVRLAQVEEYWSWPVPPAAVSADLPRSEMLRREVYTKGSGGKLMVQKFLVWRTNKTDFGYPGFVLAYTNFSSGRAEPLATEVRISSSESQIMVLADDLIATKVKSGWKLAGTEET